MSNLLNQVRCDIHKLEERGLKSLTDVQLLSNLLICEKHLAARECDEENQDNDSNSSAIADYGNKRFDRNINELYENYMRSRREYCEKKTDSNKASVLNSLNMLLAEIEDLCCTLSESAIFAEERDSIKNSIERISVV